MEMITYALIFYFFVSIVAIKLIIALIIVPKNPTHSLEIANFLPRCKELPLNLEKVSANK